jgi:4-alpha-glucanotransferase
MLESNRLQADMSNSPLINNAINNAIAQLAELHGVSASYFDYRGELREVSLESQAAILAAFGIDASDEHAAASAVSRQETIRWTRLVPPVAIVQEHAAIDVPVAVPAELGVASLDWTLRSDTGEVLNGTARLRSLKILEEGHADERTYVRFALALPDVPLGYHTLSVSLDTGLTGELRLIVAPSSCYEPEFIKGGGRVWGVAVQLYTLRSQRNWGMGDFGDLRNLIEQVAPLGCGIVGLNPLHALMPANPAHISPYSPSNRQFLNVLYICVPDVLEFGHCEQAQERVASKEFQQLVRELRDTAHVDYVRVAGAKFEILQLLYAQFRRAHLDAGTPRAQAFHAFVESQGEPLRLHAIHDALDAHFRLLGPQYWGWPSWPEEYRDPTSSTVARFARERAADVDYFLYLQWLAATQLEAAQRRAEELGMAIGLYGDVAVGANSAGSETWANRHLYLQGASVGAPPDALALKGQDWGIPPQDPNELRAQKYKPFVGLLRNNMRTVAALRLDHVMSLYRLWWVPRSLQSKDGAYVHYPVDDLMAVLALESQRNQCVVIGEDLGTVAEPMSNAMEHYRAYHYKVLLFEQYPDGRFKPPSAYVRGALATVTTHDLPTLRSWWEGHDLRLRDDLNLYPNDELKLQAQGARESERRNLMHALVENGLWHWQEHEPLPEYSAALSRAVHAFLGLSTANIALVQIEDLIGMTDPVNVPGTDKEHPNWQRKVTLDTETIFARADALDILDGMNRARRGENPNA